MRRLALAASILALAALLSGCSEVGRNEIRVRHTQQANQHAVVVENSQVRVTVLSDLGGRVTEYYLKSAGHNELWTNPDFKAASEVRGYYDWGGMEDRLSLEGLTRGAARLAKEPYKWDVARSPDNVTVTLSWQCPKWKIARSHTLYRNSTRLFTRVVVTNLDNAPRELSANPRAALAVGGDADNGDLVLQPVEGAALVRRAGAPLDVDIARPAGAWAVVLDTRKDEALVEVMRSGADEIDLRFEKSSCEAGPAQAPRTLKPGESAEISFDMFVLTGKRLAKQAESLPVPAPVARGLSSAFAGLTAHAKAIAFEREDDFYLAPWGLFRLTLPPCLVAGSKTVPFGVRVSCFADRLSGLRLSAAALRADNGTVVADTDNGTIRTTSSGASMAGGGLETGWADFLWPAEKLPSGVYAIRLDLDDNGTASRVSSEVTIAREMPGRLSAAKAADKDAFKGRYASARWHAEAAERAASEAAGNAPAAPSVRRRVEELLARSREVLEGTAVPPARGTFARFYFSRIDDSVEGWTVTLPDNYTATRKWPCLVWLHGDDAANRPFDPERRRASVESLAQRCDAVVLEPYGRGNLTWRGPAAEDVFTVIDQAGASFSIDPDRVYLMGVSSGGEGAWWLGVRSPAAFAGLGPIAAPSDHHIGYTQQDLDLLPPWQQWWIESNSAVTFAENLLNTAIDAYHGEKDRIVPVEHSVRIVERLTELGHRDLDFNDNDTGTHAAPAGEPERMLNWLMAYKALRAPKSVAIVSPYLRWARGEWARMDAFERSCEFGELRGKVDGQSVALYTHNLTALTVEAPRGLVDPAKPCVITIDGESSFSIDRMIGRQSFRLESDPKTVEPRWVRGAAPLSAAGALVKDLNVEGPMSDVFRARFILVPGTTGDNATVDACRDEAERYSREEWKKRQHVDCIVKADREITPEDRRDANLVLLGGPDANKIMKELAASLPVTFAKEGITVDGRLVAGEGSGLAFVYPNPVNPARYVLVVLSPTPEGFKRILSTVRMDFDYYVFDADTGRTGKWRDAQTSPLFGFFDQKWKFDKRTQWGRQPVEPELRLK